MQRSASLKGDTPKDSSTQAINVVPYPHHEIHAKSHFFLSGFETLGNGDTIEFTIDVPVGKKEPHMTFDVSGSTITTVELFEDSTASGGEVKEPKNNHRRNPPPSILTIKKNPDSITNSGEWLDGASWGSTGGANKFGGSMDREDEVIYDEDKQCLIRITSGAASNIVSFRAMWYEHTPKQP